VTQHVLPQILTDMVQPQDKNEQTKSNLGKAARVCGQHANICIHELTARVHCYQRTPGHLHDNSKICSALKKYI
jgi:hypothetical protein